MTAWVHKECDIMDDDTLLRFKRHGTTRNRRTCKDGMMGAGCCRFQGAAADKCTRVGREEEGTSSNRPELGCVVLALMMSFTNGSP